MDKRQFDMEIRLWLYANGVEDKPGRAESLGRLFHGIRKRSEPPRAAANPDVTGTYDARELEQLLEACR